MVLRNVSLQRVHITAIWLARYRHPSIIAWNHYGPCNHLQNFGKFIFYFCKHNKQKCSIIFVYLLGTSTTFLWGDTQKKNKNGKWHIHVIIRQDFMKEVAFKLDSMRYGYMKMDVWVVDSLSSKNQTEAKKQNKIEENKTLTLINWKLRARHGFHYSLTRLSSIRAITFLDCNHLFAFLSVYNTLNIFKKGVLFRVFIFSV